MNDEQTHEDFIRLVARMRSTQRRYFNTRSPHALDESRELEKAVDTAIERHEAVKARREQRELAI